MSRARSALLLGAMALLIFQWGCQPVRSAEPPRAVALPGVAAGEVVYQAADGSIHAVGQDGTHDRRVAAQPPPRRSGEASAQVVGWLPSRGIVACQSSYETSSYGQDQLLYLYDLVAKKVTIVTGTSPSLRPDEGDRDVSFSWDGTKMLYHSGWDEVWYAADLQTGASEPLSNEDFNRLLVPDGTPRLPGATLCVSPDGRLVLTSVLVGAGQPSQRDYLVMFDRRASLETTLPMPAWNAHFSISPDDRLIAFQAESISVVGLDGRGVKRIAKGNSPTFWLGRDVQPVR